MTDLLVRSLRLLRLLVVSMLVLAPCVALAGTITVKDSAGVTRTYVVTTNGSGQFLANNVICDPSTTTQGMDVDSHGNIGAGIYDASGTALFTTSNAGFVKAASGAFVSGSI